MRVSQAAALATVLLCPAAWCQEVVTQEPLTNKRLFAKLPVLALRKLDVDKVITAANPNETNTWMVSPSAAVASVLSSDKIPQTVKSKVTGISFEQSSVADWQPIQREAMATAVGAWTQDFEKLVDVKHEKIVDKARFGSPTEEIEAKAQLTSFLPKAKDVYAEKPPEDIAFHDGSRENVNTAAVERILATNNLIKASASKGNETGIKQYAPLDLNTEFANDIQATYYPIRSFPMLKTDLERLPAVKIAIQQAALNRKVAGAVLIDEGEVDFGIPLAFTAKEKSLQVEPSLDRRYDIYWIELAFSPSEEVLQNATELRYDIEILDSNAIVLDLVPLRFGIVENTVDKAAVPTVKVFDVEVGEMFSRTLAYKYLRPTIISYGLQTSSFGWSFTNEALDPSAKRVFAVIGVPKGTKQVNTTGAVEIKCRKYIGLASEWATTGPTPYTLNFPQ